MPDVPDWLKTVPQMTRQVQEARDAYLRWLEQQRRDAAQQWRSQADGFYASIQRTGDETV